MAKMMSLVAIKILDYDCLRDGDQIMIKADVGHGPIRNFWVDVPKDLIGTKFSSEKFHAARRFSIETSELNGFHKFHRF